MPVHARLPIVIRRARANEAALLRHLHVSYLWCIGMSGARLEDIDAFVKEMPGVDEELIRAGTYYIAEADGVVIGAGGWSAAADRIQAARSGGKPVDQTPLKGVAFIRAAFAVEFGPASRDLERSMIEHAEGEAVDAGHVIAEALVPEGCLNIYRSLGYREVRTVRLDRGGTTMATVMRKVLTGRLAAVA